MLEFAARLASLAGMPDLAPERAPARIGEVRRIALECSRAAEELGWRPGSGSRTASR